jgi:hypothetical protein
MRCTNAGVRLVGAACTKHSGCTQAMSAAKLQETTACGALTYCRGETGASRLHTKGSISIQTISATKLQENTACGALHQCRGKAGGSRLQKTQWVHTGDVSSQYKGGHIIGALHQCKGAACGNRLHKTQWAQIERWKQPVSALFAISLCSM